MVDVEFLEEHLPDLYNAVVIRENNINLIMEVMQHLGNNTVRCVALSSDGLQGGMKATDIVSSDKAGRTFTLGRLFNVVGEPIDDKGPWMRKNGGPFTANLHPLRAKTPTEILRQD